MQPMQLPITDVSAAMFAREWIAAWNSRDPDRIMGHCAPDVEYQSPLPEPLMRERGGVLRGAPEMGEYVRWRMSDPNLTFELRDVLRGARSLVIEYDDGIGMDGHVAAETLEFGDDGKIIRALCHFRPGGLHAA